MKRISMREAKAIRLSPNFTLHEFCYNELGILAENFDWYNIPEENGLESLRQLCENILEPVRSHFDKSVRIIKGYTCPRLHKALGDAPNSAHCTCHAVDIRVAGISPFTVAKWIAENLDYDMLLIEYEDYSPEYMTNPWLHVSFNAENNRRLNLTSEAGLREFKLAPNFTLWEMVRSATATAKKIFNLPDEAGIERLRLVAVNILQPVRNFFGRSVRVNSGYRSPALNAAVGSKASKTSQHMKCEAADFEIMGVDNFILAQWIAKNLEYDQLILEFYGNDKSDPNDGWVHCSYTIRRQNRKQDLTINKKGTRPGLIKD